MEKKMETTIVDWGYIGYKGVSQTLRYLIGGPHNKDSSILGSIMGSL